MRKPGRTQCPPKGEINEEAKGEFHTKVDEQAGGTEGWTETWPAPGKRQGTVAVGAQALGWVDKGFHSCFTTTGCV